MTGREGAGDAGEAAIRREIARALAEAGIDLPAGGEGKLAQHAAEMLRWNRAIRLTAITAPREIAAKHVADSLLLLRLGPFSGRFLDFGSGAGYPGIPLAVALPSVSFVLVDSSAKKCSFLSRAKALLGLRNVEVVHGRIGGRDPLPVGLFEQAAARAATPPAQAVGALLPYLVPGGRIFLYKGPPRGSSRARGEGGSGTELPPGALPGERLLLSLPFGMGEREIEEVRKG